MWEVQLRCSSPQTQLAARFHTDSSSGGFAAPALAGAEQDVSCRVSSLFSAQLCRRSSGGGSWLGEHLGSFSGKKN